MNGAIGLVVGAGLGVVGYRVLNHVAGQSTDANIASLLRTLAWGELIAFPILGVLVGGFLIGN